MAKVSPFVLIPPVVFAALAGLFAAGMLRDDGQELPSALIGQIAPAFPETPLPGYPLPEGGVLADGEVKLVNFFASWCAPCRLEHPVLTALAEEGVPVYGIAYKDIPENTAAFLEELGNPYEGIAQDPNGRAAPDWGLYGVPETYLLDKTGIIRWRMAGPITEEILAQQVTPLLRRYA